MNGQTYDTEKSNFQTQRCLKCLAFFNIWKSTFLLLQYVYNKHMRKYKVVQPVIFILK
jgi:hypothetical protein